MSYTTRAPAPLLPATDADAAAVLLSLAHLPPSPMPSSTETSASSTPLMSPSPTSPVWISNNDTTAMEEQEDPTTRRSSHGGIRGSRGVMWTQAEEECLQAALRQYGTDFKKIYHYHGPMGQTDTRLARLSHLQLVNKYHNSVRQSLFQ
ncbi:hypothetical protein BC828DRAFT_375952 [Blastocladiella britannica]|nr:hypothetical protein BC828DRAFT_375952 [Blastocladiella britannica]